MFIWHTSVHPEIYKNTKSSIVLNNSKLETIQMPIKKRMDDSVIYMLQGNNKQV